MIKKPLIRFAAGIPLLILILIVVILANEPEPSGISRGLAWKSAALLLTDRETCEQAPDLSSGKSNWYAKYRNYLYENGYLKEDGKEQSGEGFLTYREARELGNALVSGAGDSHLAGGKYDEKPIPADRWWDLYEKLRESLDQEGQIQLLNFYLYATPANEKSAPAWTAYTSRGTFQFEGLSLDSYLDWEIEVLVKGREILVLHQAVTDTITYKNVWLTAEKGTLRVILGSVERSFPYDASWDWMEEAGGAIGDLSVKRGKLQKVSLKKERITGKVLSVKEDSIEIEGYGKLKLDQDFKVYQLYGQFEERSIADVLVGYEIHDFVVARGKLCAALLVREFDAKIIRVLLMNSGFQSIFHPSVTLSAKSGLSLSFGEERVEIPAKAEVIIDSLDERLKEGRMVVAPLEKGDLIFVNSITRSLGVPSYEGSVELRREEEGLLLINELYLEDYLTKVVPSEMPDSYHEEALKAQAVCARTYAYRQIQSNAYSRYGAHVDDSTRFQVYNNLATSAKTQTAVQETYGKLLFYKNKPIEAFYFATSCGHTTDGSLWGSDPNLYPYLDGCLLQENRGVLNLSTNSAFEEFIKDKNFPSYDSSFPMYRWETTVTSRQLEEEITGVGTILNIAVTERGVGGLVKKLRIEGADGIMTMNGEGQVRAKLGNRYMTITKNDGKLMKDFDSLPSAYIAIENLGVNEENVTTFRVYGGGYGHGAGMSQNGAQAMAGNGKNYEDILQFFYPGVEVRAGDVSGGA